MSVRIDVVDVGDFVGSRQGVGDHVGLALHIPNVSRVFGYARQGVALPCSVRVGLLGKGRHETLVVCIEGECPPFHHVLKMTYPFERGKQLSVIWGPELLVGLKL